MQKLYALLITFVFMPLIAFAGGPGSGRHKSYSSSSYKSYSSSSSRSHHKSTYTPRTTSRRKSTKTSKAIGRGIAKGMKTKSTKGKTQSAMTSMPNADKKLNEQFQGHDVFMTNDGKKYYMDANGNRQFINQ